MLEELHVSGLGVIDEAWLEFGPGLNVLTGETGAGKTMVTVALGLALGARATPGLVRETRPALSVEARFSVPATEPGGWTDGDELIVARRISAEGRSSARIGGQMAPLSTLAELGGGLVEFHGQTQTERLLSPAAQTAFLDRFAGPEHMEILARYRAAHGAVIRARARLHALDTDAREREREKDLLAYQVREIEAAVVTPGDLRALAAEESRLAHAERILELAAAAGTGLAADGGVLDGLRSAVEAVHGVAGMNPVAASLSERLASLLAEADDVASELRSYRDAVETDPARLVAVRERIHVLRGLERKYGDGEEGILAYLSRARIRLDALEGSDGERDALSTEERSLGVHARRLSDLLTEGRRDAAPRLERALLKELHQLGMPGAAIEVHLAVLSTPEPDGAGPALGPDGVEWAEFRLSGGPGQPLGPLSRVASGGELSRTMLACRSVLADLDEAPTLVFDEVDAGIGGRTAGAVARRLRHVAHRRQVIVVTHLAQIAASAGRHFVVSKERGVARVRQVEAEERVEEIARMISGSDGELSLAHAREILAGGAASASVHSRGDGPSRATARSDVAG